MRILTEADVQDACVLLAPRYGARLWRNNSGALKDAGGRLVRFGLGNVSAQLNRVWKSSDLIGRTARGRFVAVECKPPGWSILGHRLTDHELAQLAFLMDVAWSGGLATFCSDPRQLEEALRRDLDRDGKILPAPQQP